MKMIGCREGSHTKYHHHLCWKPLTHTRISKKPTDHQQPSWHVPHSKRKEEKRNSWGFGLMKKDRKEIKE